MNKAEASTESKETTETKRRGRPPKAKEVVEFKDGLAGVGGIEAVSVGDIDLEDRRFQYRVREKLTDLIPTLMSEGQLVPVILWGKKSPYAIIDGYRRTAAIKQIGWTTVKAIIRRDISEDDAYRLSFLENVKRKNFTPVDMANAVWKGQALRGKSNAELQQEFNLSKRQIERYLQVIQFPEAIKDALIDEDAKMTLAHALVLHSYRVHKLDPWLKPIREGLSAQALKRQLTMSMGKRKADKMFFRAEKDGFRLFPMRFSTEMPEDERDKMRKILEKALSIIGGK